MKNRCEPQRVAGRAALVPVRGHQTPDPETPPPDRTPPQQPDEYPAPTHAPVQEPKLPEPPVRM